MSFFVRRTSPAAGELKPRVRYLTTRGQWLEDPIRAREFFSSQTALEKCRGEFDEVVNHEDVFGSPTERALP